MILLLDMVNERLCQRDVLVEDAQPVVELEDVQIATQCEEPQLLPTLCRLQRSLSALQLSHLDAGINSAAGIDNLLRFDSEGVAEVRG